MAVFKCKMCGGTLEIKDGETVATCEYCGTKQTIPRLDDDKKANLYDRANHFRRNNEYDKAMGIYEQILSEDNTDAEAYWSLVLCKYGIEYVEDPSTHKRVPTVNRAQYTSIFDDDNYKSALQYADGYQKDIYEQEANEINKIQKGILEISSKEKPFDVFICYKETDSSGRRTQDSVLANDLYHQLTQEGFRVFFSRITLEDILGTAYEPYIFAALNSAKVMVVLGTKPEYFNAVWVKNEWSRYLSLIKQSNGKKVLIPAYKDMDPYDLPEEFSHLQAQDMSKLGFMQDLIRGVKKITRSEISDSTVVKQTIINTNVNVEPLLKRAFMFLEDGEWQEADEYCEKVLDQDPENGRAYLGKLMSELHAYLPDNLKDLQEPFDDNSNYSKIMRFGDDSLKSKVQGYVKHINDRKENERLTKIYDSGIKRMKSAITEAEFLEGAEIFKSISDFKDANALMQECLDNAEICRQKEEAMKEASRLQNARREEALRLERERREKEDLIAEKKRKKFLSFAIPVICIVLAFSALLTQYIIPNNKYNKALELYNSGKYSEAATAFSNVDYKDSNEKVKECVYLNAEKLFEQEKYTEAASEFKKLKYKDSAKKVKECVYLNAKKLYKSKKYNDAAKEFKKILKYKDSSKKVEDCYFETQKKKLKKCEVGDVIKFGCYEQDDNESNGKEELEWRVLAKNDDKVLIITEKIIAGWSYDDLDGFNNGTFWEKSEIRKWLNDEFYKEAFNKKGRTLIQTTIVSADQNPKNVLKMYPNQGPATRDKVFLLSYNEAKKYFENDSDRKCESTEYASRRGGAGSWWLRTVLLDGVAMKVYDGELPEDYGENVFYSDGVRPAMWIKA